MDARPRLTRGNVHRTHPHVVPDIPCVIAAGEAHGVADVCRDFTDRWSPCQDLTIERMFGIVVVASSPGGRKLRSGVSELDELADEELVLPSIRPTDG